MNTRHAFCTGFALCAGHMLTQVFLATQANAAPTPKLQIDNSVELNRQPVSSAREALQLSRKTKDARLLLRVWSEAGSRYVVLDASREKR